MSTKVNDFRDRFERVGGANSPHAPPVPSQRASQFSWAHFLAGLGKSE
jgi:hypothetical protein